MQDIQHIIKVILYINYKNIIVYYLIMTVADKKWYCCCSKELRHMINDFKEFLINLQLQLVHRQIEKDIELVLL